MAKQYNFGLGTVTIDETRKYTPDPMTAEQIIAEGASLAVGTNKQGHHFGGAARFATDQLGLEWGLGEGLSGNGNAYAFPTLNFASTHLKNEPDKYAGMPHKISEQEFDMAMANYFACVRSRPSKPFYLSKIGLGIAGWDLETVHRIFWKYYKGEKNLIYPIEFEMPDNSTELPE